MLLAMASLTAVEMAPNAIMRYAFIAALFLPTAFTSGWVGPVMALFSTVALQGFAFSFLPSDLDMYAYISLICLLLMFKKMPGKTSIKPIFIILLIYYAFIDLVTNGEIAFCTYGYIVLFCMILGTDFYDKEGLDRWSLAFSLASLTLSVLFILNQSNFSTTYDAEAGLERSGWNDANYFSMVIGMGIISAITFLNSERKKTFIEKVVFVTAIAATFIVMVLAASRGAILAVSLAFVVYIVFSKTKKKYKFLIVLASIAFLFYLYTNDYFTLLEYRMTNLQGGTVTNGRADIWKIKLETFFNEGNIFNWLFGYGYQGGIDLGYKKGFHNDYVAILVEYGLVGFTIFLTFLLYPLRIAKGKWFADKTFIPAYAYLLLCLCSLEPFTLGTLAFPMFYIYLLYQAKLIAQTDYQQ